MARKALRPQLRSPENQQLPSVEAFVHDNDFKIQLAAIAHLAQCRFQTAPCQCPAG